eukprot:12409063-Karenia_brevis.AAC.1
MLKGFFVYDDGDVSETSVLELPEFVHTTATVVMYELQTPVLQCMLVESGRSPNCWRELLGPAEWACMRRLGVAWTHFIEVPTKGLPSEPDDIDTQIGAWPPLFDDEDAPDTDAAGRAEALLDDEEFLPDAEDHAAIFNADVQ